MQYSSKRSVSALQLFNRNLLPVAAAISSLLFLSASHAQVTTTGNVSPTGYVGNTANGTLTIAGGSTYTSSSTYAGYASGVSGVITVTGTGSTLTTSNIYAGYNGNGTLNIVNGGYAGKSTLVSLYLGYNAGASGTVNVEGAGSLLKAGGYIGYSGNGALNIFGGATVNSSSAFVGYKTGSTGIVSVNGAGSTWTDTAPLTIGNAAVPASSFTGTGLVSIENGGLVKAGSVSINNLSTLSADVGTGSSLLVGGGTGAISNNGTIRLAAGANAANGTYAPLSYGTMTGTGSVQALGGVLNANNTVTVSSAASGLAGQATSFDLSNTQRVLVTDPTSGKSVGAGFQAASTSTPVSFTASAVTGSELSLLANTAGAGQTVLSAWTFATSGITAGSPVYLSLFAGAGNPLADLTVWDYNGTSWSQFNASDLAYDGTYASFTTTSLSDFAVTSSAAPVPEPQSYALIFAALGVVGVVMRRSKNV